MTRKSPEAELAFRIEAREAYNRQEHDPPTIPPPPDTDEDEEEEGDGPDFDLENLGLCPHGASDDGDCDEPGCPGGSSGWDDQEPFG